MAKNHSIEIVGGITVIAFERTPTCEDLHAAIDDLGDNYPYELRLWDLDDFDFYLSMREIQDLAEHGKSKLRRPNRAAIVASQDLAYGESRMFEVFRQEKGHSQARVFRTKAEAIQWLQEQK